MSLDEELKENIQTTHLIHMHELAIQMERMEKEYQELLQELGLTQEQLKKDIENPDNYSVPIWKILQEEKIRLNEKFSMELSNLPNPFKTLQRLAEQKEIKRHWIFVR